MHHRGAVRLVPTANARPSTSKARFKMRPFLCYLSLWLWIQAAAALTITSVSDNGGQVEVGREVAVEWQNAVGSVNASLVSAGQSKAVRLISLLDSMLSLLLILRLGADRYYEADIKSPFLWTPTADFAWGQYSIQLQDESGDSPTTSSPFSVKNKNETASEPSLSASPTVCRSVRVTLYHD